MANDTMIDFDAETHTYTLDGRRIPHVTEIIQTVYGSGWRADDWFLKRGAAVHHAIRLMLDGTLDWATVDDRIVGRVKAAARFLDDFRLSEPGLLDSLARTEQIVSSARYRYAGTLDYWAGGVIVDWKGSLCPRAELQLGAYAGAVEEMYKAFVDRGVAVELHDDGSYRSQPYDLRRAKQVWLATLTVYNWMRKNGVKNGNGTETRYAGRTE